MKRPTLLGIGILLTVSMLPSANLRAAPIDYQYDALDRLVRVAYPDGAVIHYSYDPAGNRTQRVVSGSPILTHAITVTVAPPAGGGASCHPNPAPDGGASTCTATPNETYRFVGWSGDCTGATCVLNEVTAPKSVTAHFSPTDPGAGLLFADDFE